MYICVYTPCKTRSYNFYDLLPTTFHFWWNLPPLGYGRREKFCLNNIELFDFWFQFVVIFSFLLLVFFSGFCFVFFVSSSVYIIQVSTSITIFRANFLMIMSTVNGSILTGKKEKKTMFVLTRWPWFVVTVFLSFLFLISFINRKSS